MKIAICTPIHGSPRAQFTASLANLCIETQRAGVDITFMMTEGALLFDVRERLLREALAWGATHTLWLDADHVFPPDTLLRLLRHKKLVVGCNFARRVEPHHPTAMNAGQFVMQGAGLQQVELLGLGACLVESSVWQHLKAPYFRYMMMDRGKGPELVGEDIFFFNALLGAGIPAFVDHDLSNECGHIAEVALTLRYRHAARVHLWRSPIRTLRDLIKGRLMIFGQARAGRHCVTRDLSSRIESSRTRNGA